jgi:hypothetical protein
MAYQFDCLAVVDLCTVCSFNHPPQLDRCPGLVCGRNRLPRTGWSLCSAITRATTAPGTTEFAPPLQMTGLNTRSLFACRYPQGAARWAAAIMTIPQHPLQQVDNYHGNEACVCVCVCVFVGARAPSPARSPRTASWHGFTG